MNMTLLVDSFPEFKQASKHGDMYRVVPRLPLLLVDRSAAMSTRATGCDDATSGAALADAYDVLADHGMTSERHERPRASDPMPCE